MSSPACLPLRSTGGWWNLYRCRVPDTAAGGSGGWAAAAAAAEALHPAAAEFGFPSWTLGRKTFQVCVYVCVYVGRGVVDTSPN